MSAEDTLGWIATILSTVVFSIPAIKLIYIFEGYLSYEEIPAIFFAINYCNYYAWFIYGDITESKQFKVCNIIGWNISIFFIIIYIFYSMKEFIIYPILNLVIIVFFTWAVYRGFCIFITFDDNIGKVCVGTSLISLTSKVRLICKNITEKNYSLISLLTAAFTLVSGFLWVIYGFMRNDYYIVCPNILLVIVSILQIIVSNNNKSKYIAIGKVKEIHTIEIESNNNDDNSNKLDSVNNERNEKIEEEEIKAKPVKISTENDINEEIA